MPARPNEPDGRVRSTLAGALAATTWGLLEPLDQRIFRSDYSDIAVLGKAVTRRHWRAAGFAVHALNGAVFGLAFHELRRVTGLPSRRFALAAALGEHLALFPLGGLVDRYHPARGTAGIPSLVTMRAFGQATVRHAVFGLVLGRLVR
jgi:hypothetical protein